jgi:hypothetical protein
MSPIILLSARNRFGTQIRNIAKDTVTLRYAWLKRSDNNVRIDALAFGNFVNGSLQFLWHSTIGQKI